MASPLGTDISGYRIASDVAKSQGQNKQKGKFNFETKKKLSSS